MAYLFRLIRAISFTFLFFPLVTAILSIIGAIGYKYNGRRDAIDWSGQKWAKFVFFYLGIHLVEKGKENIPKSGCLFLFNHTSFMDIFAVERGVFGVRFGSKIELFSIPIFKQAMVAAGILPIARGNREQSIKVLQEAEERARNGERFALAPEGGRNDQGGLLPFKTGPFVFAIKTGIPVIPVIIKGSRDTWPKGSFFPCLEKDYYEISVEYLPPVSTQGYSIDTRAELTQKVREMMLPYFNLEV